MKLLLLLIFYDTVFIVIVIVVYCYCCWYCYCCYCYCCYFIPIVIVIVVFWWCYSVMIRLHHFRLLRFAFALRCPLRSLLRYVLPRYVHVYPRYVCVRTGCLPVTGCRCPRCSRSVAVCVPLFGAFCVVTARYVGAFTPFCCCYVCVVTRCARCRVAFCLRTPHAPFPFYEHAFQITRLRTIPFTPRFTGWLPVLRLPRCVALFVTFTVRLPHTVDCRFMLLLRVTSLFYVDLLLPLHFVYVCCYCWLGTVCLFAALRWLRYALRWLRYYRTLQLRCVATLRCRSARCVHYALLRVILFCNFLTFTLYICSRCSFYPLLPHAHVYLHARLFVWNVWLR